jgi:hypothetical protein
MMSRRAKILGRRINHTASNIRDLLFGGMYGVNGQNQIMGISAHLIGKRLDGVGRV